MKFNTLPFEPQVLEALDSMGFSELTPIQEQAIPIILQQKDVIACAQTGTGKTIAFILPIINYIFKNSKTEKVKTIIVVPTRELALQIDQQIEGLSYFTNVSSLAIYGGGDGQSFETERKALTTGADIIVCTPGRFISHLNMGYFDASGVSHFVLDEADRMLDMGFNEDIVKIADYLPKNRQNLMFSATFPQKIRLLANKLLNNPESINIAISKPNEGIKQGAYLVYDSQKIRLIQDILNKTNFEQVLIFTGKKLMVKEITQALRKIGIQAKGIQSDLEQKEREQVLLEFTNKKVRVLVATDILARGIDIKGINLVINYEVPKDEEDYVHRIGRTARGDNKGVALTFINKEQCYDFSKIEKLIEKTIPKIKLPEGFEDGPEYNPMKTFPSKKKFFHKRKFKN